MPSSDPLVTVITPSFNQAAFLEETLRSVEAQDYPSIEYIVIDGGSTDASVDILRKHGGRISRWISEPDRGQADAVNKGLRMAQGEIVGWLNSDDLYLSGAVSAAMSTLQSNPQVGMVYADGVLIDQNDGVLDWHRYRSLEVLDLLCFEVLLQPTVFIRRNALERVGFVDERYRLILDHDLWVRIAASYPILHVPEFWAAERTHPEAKTMASASDFYREAEQLIQRASSDPALTEVFKEHRSRIEASLACFGGRRMIDSGRYGESLGLFMRGLRRQPATALRFWYKILQAGMGASGLESMFLAYRRTRRRLQHARARVVFGPAGAQVLRGEA